MSSFIVIFITAKPAAYDIELGLKRGKPSEEGERKCVDIAIFNAAFAAYDICRAC